MGSSLFSTKIKTSYLSEALLDENKFMEEQLWLANYYGGRVGEGLLRCFGQKSELISLAWFGSTNSFDNVSNVS